MTEQGFRGQHDKTWLDRVLQRFAYSRVGGKLFITVFPAIDKRLMPLTGGRFKIGVRQPVCLLHVRGAKSGEPRVTPLLYTPNGETMVLVASKAGAQHHPAWYHNVTASPDVEAEVDGVRRPMRAREAGGRRTRGALAPRERQLLGLRRLPAAGGPAPDPGDRAGAEVGARQAISVTQLLRGPH